MDELKLEKYLEQFIIGNYDTSLETLKKIHQLHPKHIPLKI
jgi:N-hydroxyarylamine O-acetyltransferase